MTRLEAIEKIFSSITDEAVITSIGMTSREAYQFDRSRNFYLMSAMGSELALGIGLAYTRPDLNVVVISGDSSALMGLSTYALYEKLALKNLRVYVLCNYCNATTGGQPNCADTFLFMTLGNERIVTIEISPEKGNAPRIPMTPEEITRRFENAIRKQDEQVKCG